jgi:hypothetical protein
MSNESLYYSRISVVSVKSVSSGNSGSSVKSVKSVSSGNSGKLVSSGNSGNWGNSLGEGLVSSRAEWVERLKKRIVTQSCEGGILWKVIGCGWANELRAGWFKRSMENLSN